MIKPSAPLNNPPTNQHVSTSSGDTRMSGEFEKFDLAIVGAGPVGLITALAAAYTGCKDSHQKQLQIALIGPKPSAIALNRDTRTTAFMHPSLKMLRNLAILEKIETEAAPLKELRMIDDTAGLLRAPDCHFTSLELDLPYFALNIPNADLNQALIEMVSQASAIRWIETEEVTKVTSEDEQVSINTREGKMITAPFCIGADGRNSICRQAAEIETETWSYDQTAIACGFTHQLPHKAVSIEIHRPTGPLTLIPLKEHHASLVWSLKPAEAEQMVKLDDNGFIEALNKASLGFYGQINTVAKRVAFPIKGMSLKKLAAKRIALVGEAAHIVPPIGAQGMNMGLMDAACLCDAIQQSPDYAELPSNLVESYNTIRHRDVARRSKTIDLLNKSLLVDYLPFKAARTVGLTLLKQLTPLRRLVMQQGMGTPLETSSYHGESLPSLMQDPAAETAYASQS